MACDAPSPTPPASAPWAALGLTVIERDWLSSNHVVAAACGEAPATVVDTGHRRHAGLTVALVRHALGGALPARIVNTHLHSDHCGGNAALQQAAQACGAPQPQTWVPAGLQAAVQGWDEDRLGYRPTGQDCGRFAAHAGLDEPQALPLGAARWRVLAAPGHDPDARMLFEPQTRTLISGDALWEDRLAIVFPELEGRPGFAATRATLDRIEALAPRWVIPGHGPAFDDVGAALAASRARLDGFERDPTRHLRHAARALAMYRLLEATPLPAEAMRQWLAQTPLMRTLAVRLGAADDAASLARWAANLVATLCGEGLMQEDGDGRLRRPP